MKQNSQSSGYSDDSSLLCCLSTNGVAKSPAPKVRVGSRIAKDVVRAIDQQLTKILVAGLGDLQLRRPLA
jgi:hypothetical protein